MPVFINNSNKKVTSKEQLRIFNRMIEHWRCQPALCVNPEQGYQELYRNYYSSYPQVADLVNLLDASLYNPSEQLQMMAGALEPRDNTLMMVLLRLDLYRLLINNLNDLFQYTSFDKKIAFFALIQKMWIEKMEQYGIAEIGSLTNEQIAEKLETIESIKRRKIKNRSYELAKHIEWDPELLIPALIHPFSRKAIFKYIIQDKSNTFEENECQIFAFVALECLHDEYIDSVNKLDVRFNLIQWDNIGKEASYRGRSDTVKNLKLLNKQFSQSQLDSLATQMLEDAQLYEVVELQKIGAELTSEQVENFWEIAQSKGENYVQSLKEHGAQTTEAQLEAAVDDEEQSYELNTAFSQFGL